MSRHPTPHASAPAARRWRWRRREEARARLCAAHGWDESAVELVPVLASGDRIQDRPLAEIGGKALWTKELDAWLLDGRIDVAVHSLKDVETLRPDRARASPRCCRARTCATCWSARRASRRCRKARGSAPARRAARRSCSTPRPDCRIVPFRGNVATRLAKLAAGEADATFLAAAGLERLGETGVGHPLDADDWLPAPAQGAIAIECRADDAQTPRLARRDRPRARAAPR